MIRTLLLIVYLLGGASLIALPSYASQKETVHIPLTSYYIPGLVESKSQGTMVEMLRRLEQVGNLQFELSLMPTARVQQSFVKRKIYSYFPELEEFRPKQSCRTASFMQKGIIAINLAANAPITSVKQLEGLKVGAVTGYSYGLTILNNERIDLIRVNNDKSNLRKLLAGRIDAIVGDMHSTVSAVEELGLTELVNLDVNHPIELLDVFFVFPNSHSGQQHCQQVSDAIKALKGNGELFTWFGYR